MGPTPVTSTGRVSAEIPLRDKKGSNFFNRATLLVLKTLPAGLLLGTDACLDNAYQISFPKSTIQSHEHEFSATSVRQHLQKLPCSLKKRGIYSSASCTIQPTQGYNLPIKHQYQHSHAHAFLVTQPVPQVQAEHSSWGSLPAALVHGATDRLPYANLGDAPIHIRKGQLLGYVATPATLAATQAQINLVHAPDQDELPLPGELPTPPELDPQLALEADVSSEWGPEIDFRIRAILHRHKHLFRHELGLFNDGIQMPIPFKNEADLSGLKQPPIRLSARDRGAMDTILDPLRDTGRVIKVPWDQPSPVACPAFVVWDNNKPRVVVDLRRVNQRLIPDAYPLPRQDDVLSSLGGSVVFSSLDVTKGFFQQGIRPQDRWKTSFVTPHRGHEQLTVATMGLANSPGFFQNRMEALLSRFLWKFALVYIDDIIIYSRSVEEHLHHLDEVLTLLEGAGISLSLKKCHFGYQSIRMLGHRISRLGVATSADKVDIIRRMAFPATLKGLESGLNFFGYYRRFVDRFAAIAEPLNTLKTLRFRPSPHKGRMRRHFAERTSLDSSPASDDSYHELLHRAHEAWEELKRRLSVAPTLTYPDFSKEFLLYVDGSKEFGMGVAVHQIAPDGKEHPVLFLSRALTPTEQKFGATELECAALVWMLRKLPQYTDGHFTVITDHAALVNALQGKTAGRSSRLDRWALFLAGFLPRMSIKHRAGKKHSNVDGLSRFPSVAGPFSDPPLGQQTQLHDLLHLVTCDTLTTSEPTFHHTQLALDHDFANEIRKALPTDRHTRAISRRLSDQLQDDPARNTFHAFSLSDGFLWHTRHGASRLCIPTACQRHVFELAHDALGHPGFHKTYTRLLHDFFMPHAKAPLKRYIDGCPACQQSKPRNHKPFGALQPVPTPPTVLHTWSVDFVTGLPESAGFNSLLTVTDKFSKAIRILPGKEDWSAQDWANQLWRLVVKDWGLPAAVISDRDAKFTGEFWQQLMTMCKVRLRMTTAHHPAANGQAERTNATVEVMLRCLLAGQYTSSWASLLPEVERNLNCLSFDNSGTSFEVLYGVPPRFMPENPQGTSASNAVAFVTNRNQLRDTVRDCFDLAQARIALTFDRKHMPPAFHDQAYLRLTRTGRGYKLPASSKLSPTLLGPFPIRRKVSDLAYELILPSHMRLHPVISVIHLEPHETDDFNRHLPETPAPVVVDGHDEYEIETILDQKADQCLVRWRGLPEPTWEPIRTIREDAPDVIRKFQQSQRNRRRQ